MSLDQAFEALKTYTWGTDRGPLNPIEDAVATLQDQDRASLEKRLAEALDSDCSLAAKDYICRKLLIIGTPASIPTLAAMLDKKELSHMARSVLERMPDPEASSALRTAAEKLDGVLLVGVIGSLGVRQDAASIPQLSKHLSHADAQVSHAAAHALGDIRNAEAVKALSASATKEPQTQAAIQDAKLACGEALLAAGKKVEALAIYKSMANDSVPKHVKLAATRGMLACAGK
ncbi:MAG: HEAT repeat domain-containing protein [Pirellulales bacterium]|nr:HEAT repeat domain-containing protein [Pirellulales bacterium]